MTLLTPTSRRWRVPFWKVAQSCPALGVLLIALALLSAQPWQCPARRKGSHTHGISNRGGSDSSVSYVTSSLRHEKHRRERLAAEACFSQFRTLLPPPRPSSLALTVSSDDAAYLDALPVEHNRRTLQPRAEASTMVAETPAWLAKGVASLQGRRSSLSCWQHSRAFSEIIAFAQKKKKRRSKTNSWDSGSTSAFDYEWELRDFAKAVLLTEDAIGSRRIALSTLTRIMRTWFGDETLVMPFGSSVTGHAMLDSDIDVVVFVPGQELDCYKLQAQIVRALEESRDGHSFTILEVRRGRVPIVVLLDEDSGVSLDVSCQLVLSLLNSQLIRHYQTLYPGLATLVAAVKAWAALHNYGKSFRGDGLSSYTWTLMVIYYLQVTYGLPSVHRDLDYSDESNYTLEFGRWVYLPGVLKSELLSDVLIGFFKFYAWTYDWGSEVVCVRTGQRNSVEAAGRGFLPTRSMLFVQDPIDPTVDLASCRKVPGIMRAFKATHRKLAFGQQSLRTLLGDWLPTQPEASDLQHRWTRSARLEFTNVLQSKWRFQVLAPSGAHMNFLDWLFLQREKLEENRMKVELLRKEMKRAKQKRRKERKRMAREAEAELAREAEAAAATESVRHQLEEEAEDDDVADDPMHLAGEEDDQMLHLLLRSQHEQQIEQIQQENQEQQEQQQQEEQQQEQQQQQQQQRQRQRQRRQQQQEEEERVADDPPIRQEVHAFESKQKEEEQQLGKSFLKSNGKPPPHLPWDLQDSKMAELHQPFKPSQIQQARRRQKELLQRAALQNQEQRRQQQNERGRMRRKRRKEKEEEQRQWQPQETQQGLQQARQLPGQQEQQQRRQKPAPADGVQGIGRETPGAPAQPPPVGPVALMPDGARHLTIF